MKAIHSKVNIVPVIAKADTLTLRERDRLKRRVGFMCTHTHTLKHTLLVCSQLLFSMHSSFTYNCFLAKGYDWNVWKALVSRMLRAFEACYTLCLLSYLQLNVVAIRVAPCIIH